MANNDYLVTLDRDALADYSTAQLREAAIKGDLYSQRETIATLPISTPEIVGKSGTLTVLDKAITTLLAAYAGREPIVETTYSGAVEIKVWQVDETIRQNLRYYTERAHEAAGSFNGND